jgi:Protein of unknown function (DUF1360)
MSTVDATAGYAPAGEDRPLAAYASLTATFSIALAAALASLHAAGKQLADRPRAGDLLLAAVATHKVSRLLAKDRVTSFVRAPFTRYQAAAGHGEVEEQPRGSGLRLAIGELLVCPFCLAQWVSAAFAVGLVAAPRVTRFFAGIYVAETVSDVLQLAYKAAEDRA